MTVIGGGRVGSARRCLAVQASCRRFRFSDAAELAEGESRSAARHRVCRRSADLFRRLRARPTACSSHSCAASRRLISSTATSRCSYSSRQHQDRRRKYARFVVSTVDILRSWRQARPGSSTGSPLDTASSVHPDAWLAPLVKALILGEHGDSMLPIWSSARSMACRSGCPNAVHRPMFPVAQGSGAEVIRRAARAGPGGHPRRDAGLNKQSCCRSPRWSTYGIAIPASRPAVARRRIDKHVELSCGRRK